MVFSSIIALAVLPLAVTAAPSGRLVNGIGAATVFPMTNFVDCPVNAATLTLPLNQTALAVPAGVSPVNIALGVGVQNYTCSAAGTYTYVSLLLLFFLVLSSSLHTSNFIFDSCIAAQSAPLQNSSTLAASSTRPSSPKSRTTSSAYPPQ